MERQGGCARLLKRFVENCLANVSNFSANYLFLMAVRLQSAHIRADAECPDGGGEPRAGWIYLVERLKGASAMKKTIMILGAVALMAAGCTTNPYTGEKRASRTVTSGAGGAAAGAAAGAVIGAIAGNAGKGAAIGAASGAAIGVGIGVYQDRQQAKLRERLANSGVSVTRNGDNIILNMPSDITFGVNQSDITPGFYETLNSVALVLKEYNKTTVSVYGHADSTGSDSYNMQLSQRRAASVANYLASQGVAAGRLNAIGFGESNPIADNSTEAGRAANRRVEIVIDPIESQFNS